MKTIVLLLSALLSASPVAFAQTPGNSLKGIYRGSFSNGDEFSLVVSRKGDASLFIVGRVSKSTGFFSNFSLGDDGSFSLSKEGTTLNGKIAPGAVTGSVPQRSQTFSGSISAGSSSYAGYHIGLLHDRLGNEAACFIVVSADGRALFYFASGANEDGAIGTVDSQGRLTLTSAAGLQVTGSLGGAVEGGGYIGSVTMSPYGLLGFSTSRKDSSYRLANIATRGFVGTGSNVLIAGFVVSSGAKTLLVRAGGPALIPFGLTGVIEDPKLEIYDSAGKLVAQNDNWISAEVLDAANSVGAFAFPAGSKDAAIVVNLEPGSYSAQVRGTNNSTGTAIVEIYEVK